MEQKLGKKSSSWSSLSSSRRQSMGNKKSAWSCSSELLVDQLVNCAICSNELCEPITMSCGHSFCRVCTINWCFVYKHYNCPICRCPLADKSLPSVNLTLKYLIALVKERNLDCALDVQTSRSLDSSHTLDTHFLDHQRLINKIEQNLRESSSSTPTAKTTTTLTNCQNNKSSSQTAAMHWRHDNGSDEPDDKFVTSSSSSSSSSTDRFDSTLSRLNLVYFPFYLCLTLWGLVFLGFLNIVKRMIGR